MTKLSERLDVRNIYSKGCDAVASCIAAISELSAASSATKTWAVRLNKEFVLKKNRWK